MTIKDFIKKWGDFDKLNKLQEEKDKLDLYRDELIEKLKEYAPLSLKSKGILILLGSILCGGMFLGISLVSTTAISVIISTTMISAGMGAFLSSVGISLYDEKQKSDGDKIRDEIARVNDKIRSQFKELDILKNVCYQINNDKKFVDRLLSLNILSNDKTISEFESSLLFGLEEKNSLSSLLYLVQNDKLSKKIYSNSTKELDNLREKCMIVDEELQPYKDGGNNYVRHKRSERYRNNDTLESNEEKSNGYSGS